MRGGLKVKECQLSRMQRSLCTSGWLTRRVWFNILHPLALFRLSILLLADSCRNAFSPSTRAHARVQKDSVK